MAVRPATGSAAAARDTSPPNEPTPRRRLRWFTDRSINVKIGAVIGLLTLVAAVVGVGGFLALSTARGEVTTLKTQAFDGAVALGDVRADALSMRNALANYALSTTPALKNRYSAAVKDADAAVVRDAAAYSASGPADPADWRTFQTQWATVLQVRDGELMAYAAANDFANFTRVRDARLLPPINAAFTALDKLRTAQRASASAQVQHSLANVDTSTRAALIALVVGLAISVPVAIAVARGIVRAVGRVQTVVEALAAGDLTRSSGLRTRDELGRMGASLDEAVAGLRTVMGTVIASADAVAASSEELSASSAQISASAEETSAQSGVVSGAAEEVSRSVQTVAAGAEEMGASIREIASNAADASQVAQKAVQAAQTTTATVSKLGESSAEIGNVIKVITSIAEQTNLLALNATIEAARAGEAGKGFAVVANEVKELAQETAKATEDIARRVQAIQGDTDAAVQAIGEISSIVAQIADRQTTIASAVEEQTATTQEMARSVTEAAAGTGQIADNITGVSTAAESTTQALTQTRTAVDELSRMAADLRSTVGRFTY